MMYLELFGGLIYLLLGGDLLVRGAVALAKRAAIPPVVVGLTVVAFGTSAPELMVSLNAVLSGYPGISIGNVVGSNIANVLLVLGVPALVFPTSCDQPYIGRHGAFMLMASLVFVLLCFLGPLEFPHAGVLLVLLALFLFAAHRWRVEGVYADASDELERVLGLPSTAARIALFLVLGVIGLPLGAQLMVSGGVEIAQAAGVSNDVIGLTIFAVGTSLPELGTTFVAALHRQPDVAVGNVVGSNVFNLLAIMGIAVVVAPGGIPVPESFLRLDLWMMVGAAGLLAGFAFTGGSIGRTWGIGFLAAYAIYVGMLFG